MSVFTQPKEVFFHGRKAGLAPKRKFNAGPVSLYYDKGTIKYLEVNKVEIIRSIYPSFRNAEWETVAPEIIEEKIEQNDGYFYIKFKAKYQRQDIHFETNYSIEGKEDGTLRILYKGKSFSDFKKNRIGICLLHPAALAEKEMAITHTDSSLEKLYLPQLISPAPTLKDIKSLQWSPAVGVRASLTFTGNTFETEDQRNWGDDSFKTYCPPIGEPFPVQMKTGDIVEQEIILQVQTEAFQPETDDSKIKFEIFDDRTFPLPSIGVGRSSATERLTEQEMSLLKPLRFSHVRVDLQLYLDDWQKIYHDALAEAMHLDYQLELALFLKGDVTRQAAQIIKKIDPRQIKIANLYAADEYVTPGFILQNLLPMFKKEWPQVKIGAGTDAYFTELNFNRIQHPQLDFLTYSFNPQVHHFDNDSLIETARATHYQVQTCRAFSGKTVHVSPFTLKPRWNPYAGNNTEIPPAALPPQVDERQMSLLNAGYTISALKYLAQAGAESITIFETVGERGLMMGEAGSRYESFVAEPFTFFPVYFALREILTDDGWEIVHTKSSDRLKVDGICLRKNGDVKVLIANMTCERQVVTVTREPSLKAFISYFDHLNSPEFYKNNRYKAVAETKLTDQALKVELLPFAFVVVEFLFN